MLLAGRARLLDNATLRQQLSSLERHVLAGREVVKHPAVASARDDLATSACGALVMADRLRQQAQAEPPIVVPYIASRPRQVPGGSVYGAGTAAVAADSPHRPSREQPWYPYVRGNW
jgi:hypothetical protein